MRTQGNATIARIKALILEIIGDRRPRGVVPAFSFQVSQDQWQDLDSDKRLSDYNLTGGRVNAYILWDPAP